MHLTNSQTLSLIALLAMSTTSLASPTCILTARGSTPQHGKVSRSIFHMNAPRCSDDAGSSRVQKRADVNVAAKGGENANNFDLGKLMDMIEGFLSGGSKGDGGEKEGGGEKDGGEGEGGAGEGGAGEGGAGEGGAGEGGAGEGGAGEGGAGEGGAGEGGAGEGGAGEGGSGEGGSGEGGAGEGGEPTEGSPTTPGGGEPTEGTPTEGTPTEGTSTKGGAGGIESPAAGEGGSPETTPVGRLPGSRTPAAKFPIFTPTPSSSPAQ